MHQFIHRLSRVMAYLGGFMLVVLIALTCVSVVGRSLNGFLHGDLMQNWAPGFAAWALNIGVGPVNGDFELIEAGVAFSIFAFFPICQLSAGHATVELFTSFIPARLNRFIEFMIDVLFALVLVLIAVQLCSGMLSKMRSGQTTLLLEFPVWWAYGLSLVGAVMAAVIAVYIVVNRVLPSRNQQPISTGGAHQ